MSKTNFNRRLKIENEKGDIVRFGDLANCMIYDSTILHDVFRLTKTICSSTSLEYAKVDYTYNRGFVEVIKRFIDKEVFNNSDEYVQHLIVNDILERLTEKEIIDPFTFCLN